MAKRDTGAAARAPIALTIGGSDPSGGAGIQADLKTFHQHGVYGSSAITLITVQNTLGVSAVSLLDPALVEAQIDAVLDDLSVRAIKTGALGGAAIIGAVARCLERRKDIALVVDPVMLSKNGNPLLAEDAVDVLVTALLPLATLVTPNAHEAAALARMTKIATVQDAERAAERLVATTGARAVLVKGGHVHEEGDATDVLLEQGREPWALTMPRIATKHTHGTGCTLSAAIAARLAQGAALREAYTGARKFLQRALERGPGCEGHGICPVDHFAPV